MTYSFPFKTATEWQALFEFMLAIGSQYRILWSNFSAELTCTKMSGNLSEKDARKINYIN